MTSIVKPMLQKRIFFATHFYFTLGKLINIQVHKLYTLLLYIYIYIYGSGAYLDINFREEGLKKILYILKRQNIRKFVWFFYRKIIDCSTSGNNIWSQYQLWRLLVVMIFLPKSLRIELLIVYRDYAGCKQ